MTTGEFRGVDHDLLADYLGGALDGTPEQTAVARLIDEDPTWAGAHAALAPAVAQVAPTSPPGARPPPRCRSPSPTGSPPRSPAPGRPSTPQGRPNT
ncbi:hypothetical protein JNW88_30960 [Micromonospora sp. ATA32]|nr:hypothetical protein [Micromonospora sp. ATA32]